MEASPELVEVTRRLLHAFETGDADSVCDLLSDHPGATSVGTDPREIWSGTDARTMLRVQMAESLAAGDVGNTEYDIVAYRSASSGWALATAPLIVDPRRNIRVTLVYELIRAQWKIVHAHWSFGILNEDLWEYTITTSIDAVAHRVDVERPTMGDVAASDGTVTLLFSDIEGSTALLDTIGDRRFQNLLLWHNRTVRATLAVHGGHEAGYQGDGFMLAFPSARAALRCAHAIQTAISTGPPDDLPPIRVRMGLHTGEALRDRADFYGRVVHYAARVAGAARGGEILVSSVVRELLRGDDTFAFDDGRAVEFKGFSGDQTVYAVTAAS